MRRYDYRGWARYRLNEALEEVEVLWEKERTKRVDLDQELLLEQKEHADKIYELRETKKLLNKQEDSRYELERRLRSAEDSTKVAQEQLQHVRREKRELQHRLTLLQEDLRQAEEAASRARMAAREEAQKVEALRRENVLDAEHASSLEKQESATHHNRDAEWVKRINEMRHTHMVEKKRWEAERIGSSSNLCHEYLFQDQIYFHSTTRVSSTSTHLVRS